MLTLVGLSFVIALSGRSMIKGLVMAAAGFMISMVGLDAQAGVPRYAFDQLYLWDGINLVALVVGLFGGAELLQLMLSKASIATKGAAADPYAGMGQGVRETFKHWRVVLRSSLIGVGGVSSRAWVVRSRSSSPTAPPARPLSTPRSSARGRWRV